MRTMKIPALVFITLLAALLVTCGGSTNKPTKSGRATRAAPQVEEVRYGPHQRNRLDVHRPPTNFTGPRPALIHVHGGGWVVGDKSKLVSASRQLAQHGMVVFAPNYRLVRGLKTRWPACWQDMQAVLRWVQDNAAKYQVDPHRVAALGYSAGGHLVALLGTRPETRKQIRCVVDFFGPVDMRPEMPGGRGSGLLIGSSVIKDRKLFLAASPIHHVSAGTPPFLILHGDKDRVVPLAQSQRFLKVLLAHKVDAQLQVYPGMHHAFQRLSDARSRAASRDAYQRSIVFLGKYLGF